MGAVDRQSITKLIFLRKEFIALNLVVWNALWTRMLWYLTEILRSSETGIGLHVVVWVSLITYRRQTFEAISLIRTLARYHILSTLILYRSRDEIIETILQPCFIMVDINNVQVFEGVFNAIIILFHLLCGQQGIEPCRLRCLSLLWSALAKWLMIRDWCAMTSFLLFYDALVLGVMYLLWNWL